MTSVSTGQRGGTKKQVKTDHQEVDRYFLRERADRRMAFVRVTAGAVATLVALTCPDRTEAFGVSPGAAAAAAKGRVHIQEGATSSFLKARSRGGTSGEASSTSLLSTYLIKPDMAQTRGSEWRKLRTRGPGFCEKVRVRWSLPLVIDFARA